MGCQGRSDSFQNLLAAINVCGFRRGRLKPGLQSQALQGTHSDMPGPLPASPWPSSSVSQSPVDRRLMGQVTPWTQGQLAMISKEQNQRHGNQAWASQIEVKSSGVTLYLVTSPGNTRPIGNFISTHRMLQLGIVGGVWPCRLGG